MKTVIEMAREAGYMRTVNGGAEVSMASMGCLERFAALVRADERLKCIKDADDQWVKNPNVSGGDAIRARGQAT
jgi:hypothetical protein